MIIYQNSIEGFIRHCKRENQDLLDCSIKANMHKKLGRGVSPSEERSWRTTLVKIAAFFNDLKEKDKQFVFLEFKIPTTQKRIDVILAGSDNAKKNLLIIELKGWSRSFYSEIPETLKIDAKYYPGHPNAEAYEYKYLLTEQFSDINTIFTNIEAISLLPNYEIVKNDPIMDSQFKKIIDKIELYHKANIGDFKQKIEKLFIRGINNSLVDKLNKLEYHPTLNFQKHLEEQFSNIHLSISQARAYNTIRREIDLHLLEPNRKKLITISGMPGSGKTIVAFKILGYLYAIKKKTAKLQLPGPEFRDAFKKTYQKNDFTNMIGGAYSKGEHSIMIIDEAHKAYGQGTSKQFYSETFKNQEFVIALIDDKQVVNKKGHTKKDIVEKATINKFFHIPITLEEQFRNGGDALYIDWLNNWIFEEDNYQDFYVNNNYDFVVLEDQEFNKTYHEFYWKTNSRMCSFWTQKWNAEFDEEDKVKKLIKVGSSNYVWNPNNYWVKSFIQNNPYKKIPKYFMKNVVEKNFNKDKKGPEYIAYFNTIQGSEFEYIFVHIPKLFYLNKQNKLDVDLSQLDMIDMKTQVWTKNHIPNPEKEEINKIYMKNRLLVNLTRGTKGTFIFCEDAKLQNWIREKIIKK